MAIDGGMRDKLEPGMRLTARHKGEQHVAEVVAAEDSKLQFRLADGREFKSPSAAGSAVMGGQACNGWRWWSIAGHRGRSSVGEDATHLAEGKPCGAEAGAPAEDGRAAGGSARGRFRRF